MPEPMLPMEIEHRSFAILSAELGPVNLPPEELAVLHRVIHTTADFDYAENLVFSPGATAKGIEALRGRATIVTDTNMALAGVNKTALARLGGSAVCYMAEPAVAEAAREAGVTRARAAVDHALSLPGTLIFAVGNAPTALMRLREHIDAGRIRPALIIAAPVGFVHVVESKEAILPLDIPHIVARGRKGGSNVAAAICNALLYQATGER